MWQRRLAEDCVHDLDMRNVMLHASTVFHMWQAGPQTFGVVCTMLQAKYSHEAATQC